MNGYLNLLDFQDRMNAGGDHYQRMLYALAAGQGARAVIETGAGPDGGSGQAFCYAMAEVAEVSGKDVKGLVSIELRPEHPRAGLVEEVTKHTGVTWKVVYGDSLDVNVKKLPLKACDILYIDGDHGGEHALGDFERLRPLVQPGGLVIFDDYPCATGVVAAVEEVQRRHNLIGVHLKHDWETGNGFYVFRLP